MKTVTIVLSDAHGELGIVYKTKTGMDIAYQDEDIEGWQQITLERRMQVFSTQSGHSYRIWERVEVPVSRPCEYVW